MVTMTREEAEQMYLLDTIAILADYDGYRSPEGLMALVDETRSRLRKLYRHEITGEDVGGEIA